MLCGVKCSMSTLLNCNSSVYNADGIEEENLQISHLTGWNSSGAAAKAALCMYSGSESFLFFSLYRCCCIKSSWFFVSCVGLLSWKAWKGKSIARKAECQENNILLQSLRNAGIVMKWLNSLTI